MAEESSIDERNEYYKELREEKRKQREETEAEKSKKYQSERKNSSLFSKLSKADPTSVFKKTLTTPLSPFAFLLKWIFKILALILAVGLAFIILIFLFQFFTGGGTSFLGTQTSILSSQISGPIVSSLSTVKNFVLDPVGTVATYGTFKNPQTIEKTKPQGIEFRNFKTKKDIYRERDPIEAVANVKIYALEDSPTQVEFGCYLYDVVSLESLNLKSAAQGEPKLYGEEDGQNYVTILANEDKILNVQCSFKEQELYNIKFGDSRTISEKITLTANYKDFIVNSRIKVYTLQSSILSNLEKQNINPFAHFKINDPLVSSDRSVRPEQIKKGPVILSFDLTDEQPLKEGPTYLLGLELKNDKTSWNGKISSLQMLKLIFPENFKPNLENCKEFYNPYSDNNVFYLKPNIIAKITENEDVSNQRFYCEFSIDPSAVNEDMSFSLINAEAKFDYEFQAYTSATISKNLISSTIEEIKS